MPYFITQSKAGLCRVVWSKLTHVDRTFQEDNDATALLLQRPSF
jgi:hypothetical protein